MRKLAALFAMLAILASPITVLADGPVAPGPDSDPEMAAAFRNANDTLGSGQHTGPARHRGQVQLPESRLCRQRP